MADANIGQSEGHNPEGYKKDPFLPVGQHVANNKNSENGELEQRMVEEIESLCMNCHEDVGIRSYTPGLSLKKSIREQPASS